jgi:hypothetical protein
MIAIACSCQRQLLVAFGHKVMEFDHPPDFGVNVFSPHMPKESARREVLPARLVLRHPLFKPLGCPVVRDGLPLLDTYHRFQRCLADVGEVVM